MRLIAAIAIVIGISGSTVRAAPAASALTIGRPSWKATISHARIAVSPRAMHTHAVLTLTVSTDDTRARNVATSLTMPRKSRVVGMAVTIGDGPRVSAVTMWKGPARERYREITGGGRDPALVEYDYERNGTAHYTVQVFPVVQNTPARVEIEIELPTTRALELKTEGEIATVELDVAGMTETVTAFSRSRRIAIPKPVQRVVATDTLQSEALVLVPDAVDDTTSLFADEPGRTVMANRPTLALRTRPQRQVEMMTGPKLALQATSTSDDEADAESSLEFRRRLRSRLSGVRGCLAGASGPARIDVRFAIVPNGKVAGVSVGGAGEQANKCVVAEVTRWQFRASENVVLVDQPIIIAGASAR